MVCCRSRHPLRKGPLQRANEVATVTDVDVDKRLVCVQIIWAAARERAGKGKRAWEVYVETFRLVDDMAETDREFDGAGGGVGAALW